MFKKILLLFLLGIYLIPSALSAKTSLGISPDIIFNHALQPGSVFQTFIHIQHNQNKETVLTITKNAGLANRWIEINNNKPIILKPNNIDFKLPISITVPKDAKTADYIGTIDLLIENSQNSNTVGTKIGEKIKLNLAVSKNNIDNIKITNIESITAVGPLKKFGFNIPGKIILTVNTENKGNTSFTNKKIIIKLVDKQNNNVLLNKETLTRIDNLPFTKNRVQIEIPVKNLPLINSTALINIIDKNNIENNFTQQLDFKVKKSNQNMTESFFLIINYYLKSIVIILLILLGLITLKKINTYRKLKKLF